MSTPGTAIDIDALAWARQDGLLPAIVQDAATLRVLMLGYMDREALASTLQRGRVTFFSRSRRRQWCKGETSGHWLELVSIEADCDGDTLLVVARAHGPTCHLGRCSCFAHAPGDAVGALDALVGARIAAPSTGYTDRLLASGIARMAQKVGEEGVETLKCSKTIQDSKEENSREVAIPASRRPMSRTLKSGTSLVRQDKE